MNKKGVTIIEVMSVLIIAAVILLLLFPKKADKIDTSKNSEYIKEVKEIVNKANLMYQNATYINDANYFTRVSYNTYSIILDKIVGITDFIDPYGYLYDRNDTKISYIRDGDSTKIKVTVKSCSSDLSDGIHRCYEIVDEDYEKLSEKSVKNTVH